jgi:acylphosphatase
MSRERERLRLIYTGRVQGVGFRYTTASIARRHPVAGYVRNLRDGSVELVVEGPSSAVRTMLDEIAEAFRGNIEECRSSEDAGSEDFVGFSVRH